MKVDKEWKMLNELRVTDRDYSALQYSYKYAKKNKDIRALGGGCYSGMEPVTVHVIEQIEIKENKLGDILYRVVGKHNEENEYQKFNTQFGTYVSNDNGEFGGDLITPGGEIVHGNFRYIFDLKDKVYAIDTGAHLVSAHFKLLQFTDPAHYERLYSVGETFGLFKDDKKNKDISEELSCSAIDVKDDKAFILLSGHIFKYNSNGDRQWWSETRLLKIEKEEVEEVVRLTGASLSYIQNIIVQDNLLYISCDKMVIKYDLATKSLTYLTCLSKEDETNLLENERTGNH